MSTPPLSPTLGRPAQFSWKRALAHALLAMVAVVVLGAAGFGWLARPASNATKFGEGVGRLAGFTGVIAFAVSWLRQTGRRKAGLGVAIGVATLIGAGFAALVMTRSAHPTVPLTEAERVPLVIVDEGGERRLRHPAFGFSILHPGATFREAPDVAQAMEGAGRDPATQHYGFSDPDDRSALVISVMKGMGGTRASLVEHVDGFQRGFASMPASAAALQWTGKEITWDAGRHEAHLGATFGGGMRLELAAYAVMRAGQPPFIVNVMVMAPRPDLLAKLLASFRS
jgi:hypothetical protein